MDQYMSDVLSCAISWTLPQKLNEEDYLRTVKSPPKFKSPYKKWFIQNVSNIIVNGTGKQKRSRAIYMTFYWVRDWV